MKLLCCTRAYAIAWLAMISFLAGGVNSKASAVTNGYITAVLRSECTSDPTPPPPVGATNIGPDYVILTVADADPRHEPREFPGITGDARDSGADPDEATHDNDHAHDVRYLHGREPIHTERRIASAG